MFKKNKTDPLKDKILTILQKENGPITLDAIMEQLNEPNVSQNMVIARLAQLKAKRKTMILQVKHEKISNGTIETLNEIPQKVWVYTLE